MTAASAVRTAPSRNKLVIRAVPGSAAQTRTPNGRLRQYFRRGIDFSRISQSYPNGSLCGSINVSERPWASKRQPIDYKQCCTDRLNAQG